MMICSLVAMTELKKCCITQMHICSGYFTQVSELWPVGLLFIFLHENMPCGHLTKVRLFSIHNMFSWSDKKKTVDSLSRPRLSRIIAYLKVKIWSLPKLENLITGNKILWKRLEIAPNFSFPQYFKDISNFKSPNTYTFVKCGCSI